VIELLNKRLATKTHIAPLVLFRIVFGLLMFVSLLRFVYKGWVYTLYVKPHVYFPYYGFEWVKPLGETGMYIVFGILIASALCITIGLLYRINAVVFFTLFTYVELIDKTNYLNHYYFISLIAFILIVVPANGAFSADNRIFKKPELTHVPVLYQLLLQLQMFALYFFAGVAKINSDWLLHALPLKLWLPAFSHYPLIGPFMEEAWVAFAFSWFGCTYDLLIGFFLFNRRTVYYAYMAVIVFHLATAAFFNIGMFPYIMMAITTIFFRTELHRRALAMLKRLFGYNQSRSSETFAAPRWLKLGFVVYMLLQLLLPMRYLLYPGHLFWTEQGFRFSWRVMLMEKAGTAFFFVKDAASGREVEVDNKTYLTYLQEKQMSTQPDMMVDFAKFLKAEFEHKGFTNPSVRVESFVTLNGLPSRRFVSNTVDLSTQSNNPFKQKEWICVY